MAVLVRSVGPDRPAHAAHGQPCSYAPGRPGIPALAVAAEDANRIVRLTAAGRRVRMRLVTSGHPGPDVAVGQRRRARSWAASGRTRSCWSAGTWTRGTSAPGASDDGVGCVITWEALRLMKQLGLRPRRTVRVVLWTNEEHGLAGASAYAERYAATAANHVLALEADSGVFAPATLGFTGSLRRAARDGADRHPADAARACRTSAPGGGGADIGPIVQAGNVPAMAYLGDPGRYFVIHHTAADTVERIAPAGSVEGRRRDRGDGVRGRRDARAAAAVERFSVLR